jgi:predicted nucleic acid-binding protein
MTLKPRYVFDNNAIVSALLLEHSLSGQAFYGGQDLLLLHPFHGIPVLTPAQFLQSLAQESDGRQGPG